MGTITICDPALGEIRMQGMLTESELERIEEFANTPGHKQTPEQLLPDEHDT